MEQTSRPNLKGAAFHFIQDRVETLMDVMKYPALQQAQLYLVDWGYNTPLQRREAAATNRIRVVSMNEFRSLHGLIRT